MGRSPQEPPRRVARARRPRDAAEPKSQHILNAASNLLGVSLIIITGIHITSFARHSITDGAALAAAACLTASCFFSYQSIRGGPPMWEAAADRLFLTAQLLLLASVTALWL